MIKRQIVRYLLKKRGICVDRTSDVAMSRQLNRLENGEGGVPCASIVDSCVSGDIGMGSGSRIDSARVYGTVSLGRYANINGPGTVVEGFRSGVKIGAFSSVAMNCVLIDSNHRTDRASSFCIGHTFFGEPYVDDLVSNGEVVLQEDVWVGAGCTVLGGVTVGRGSVIGAGSVVTKDIPPYAIAVGIPAKVVAFRFSKETIDELEASCWFEWPLEKIMENKEFFMKSWG